MFGEISCFCMLALLACPAAALAEPVYALKYLEPSFHELQTGRANELQVEAAHGSTLMEAHDINDARHILGKACRDGECPPVRPGLVSTVPEPGSHALLAAGLALLAGWRKSDRRESLRFS